MKRLSLRELALLCSPLAILVATPVAIGAWHRLEPPRNPSAKIVFILTPRRDLKAAQGQALAFGWTAKAMNSPQPRINVMFSERIVASGHGRSLVLFQSPAPTNVKSPTNRDYYTRHITQSSTEGTDVGHIIKVSAPHVPAWADKVEWQGEFLALPSTKGGSSPTMVPALRKQARTPGAIHLFKRFPVAFAKNTGDAAT